MLRLGTCVGLTVILLALATGASATGTNGHVSFFFAKGRPFAGGSYSPLVGVVREGNQGIDWTLSCHAKIRRTPLATAIRDYGIAQICSISVPRGTVGRILYVAFSASGTGPETGLKWEQRGVSLSWKIRRR